MKTAQEPLTGPLPQKGHLQDALFAGQEVPPPCSAENSQQQDPSKDSTDNLNRSRCQFTYSDGRRCGNERASLCLHHTSHRSRDRGGEVAPDPALEGLCADLTTATNINRALAHVFLLMAQGRIPQKQAVAFGYLAQLLLQTVAGVRGEFVSAYGYQPWEERLTAGLERSEDHPEDDPEDDPPPSPGRGPSGGGGESPEQPINGVVDRQKGVPITPFLADKKVEPQKALRRERHGDQELRGDKEGITPFLPHKKVNKTHLTDESFREGLSVADMESLEARIEDLFAGKYDVTPEGRREATVLNYEMELLKPPGSKPPKGYFGEVVSLVRHLQAGKAPAPARQDLFLNYYGQPIKTTDQYPRQWWEPKPDPASAKSHADPTPQPPVSPAPASPPASHSEKPAAPQSAIAAAIPQASTGSRDDHSVAPPSRRQSTPPLGTFDVPPSAPALPARLD